MIVFSRNRVRREMGIVMRYSILEELPTVVALNIIDPMNENNRRTLNKDDPVPILSVSKVSRISQPNKGTTQLIPQMIKTAKSTAAIGRNNRRIALLCSVRFPFAPETLKLCVKSCFNKIHKSLSVTSRHQDTPQSFACQGHLSKTEKSLQAISHLLPAP